MKRLWARTGRVATGIAATVALAAPAPAGAFEPRVPESFFGVSAPDLWYMNVNNQYAQRDSQLTSMKAAGIDWVRTEIGWPEVEPNAPNAGAHAYSWTSVDRQFEAFASRGMELFPLLMATPAWATDPSAVAAGCPVRRGAVAPSRRADFAAFAGRFTARYGPGGTFWASRPDLSYHPVTRIEVWNEPNYRPFWCPTIDPEGYATLLRLTADEITAENAEVDVVLGGLSAIKDPVYEGQTLKGMPVDTFLNRAIAEEPSLVDKVDAIGLHPYDLDPDANLTLLGWAHRRMEEVGLSGAEIAITEFGWSSGGLIEAAVSEALRASNYERFANQLARTDCRVTAVAAHTWQSPELDLFNPSHWLGITSPLTGLLYPTGEAYRDVIALFEGRGSTPAPRDTITLCGDPEPPDQDGDGVPDEEDDYPLDPTRWEGSDEPPPPPPPGEDPPEPRIAPARATDSFYGATVVELPSDLEDLVAQYDAMSSARISRVRQRMVWQQFEPAGPAASTASEPWRWLDRLVLRMALEGIGLVPAFGEPPAWAETSPAGVDAAFASFLERFAGRYGRGGTFWDENRHLDPELAVRDYQIWEEANLNDNAPDGSAAASEYASMYVQARAALRAVDPGARAIASVSELGHAAHAADFIRQMVASRPALEGHIDGVYAMAGYARDVPSIERLARELRFALDDTDNPASSIQLGFGAPTGGPGAMTEAQRADLYEQVASRMPRGDCGVDGIFAHAWTTPEDDPGNAWDWFGIADPESAELSEAAASYGDAAGAMLGYGPGEAPRETVHPCDRPAPDGDGDGSPDPLDPAPLDPEVVGPAGTPPPAPTLDATPAAVTASRSAGFAYHATGAISFQCKLDTASYEGCPATGKTYSNLAHGAHELTIRAVDELGLVGSETRYGWAVDLQGPTAAFTETPASPSLDGQLRFEFSAGEEDATYRCLIDGGQWFTCESPLEFGTGEGYHVVRVSGIDAVGNIGPVQVATLEVHLVPGATSIDGGPEAGSTVAPSPRFVFSAPYAASYECRFDSAAFAACSEPGAHTPVQPLPSGPHTFVVRAVGGTGIRGPATSRGFSVSAPPPPAAQAPTVQIVKPPPRRTVDRTPTIRFSVTAASGAISECAVDGARWTRCGSPYTTRRLKRGRHVVSVRARAGAASSAAKSVRFRVVKRKR